MATSTGKGTVVSYYGYTFEVPWTGHKSDSETGQRVAIIFNNGRVVKFVNPALLQYDPVSDRPELMDHSYFTKDSRGRAPLSKYEQLSDVLATAPSQLSPFLSHRKFRRIRTLLEIKGLMFEHNPYIPDIFSFQTKHYRGFELSGLSRGSQDLVLDIFDQTDHWFLITMDGGIGSDAKLTQADANRIIDSFRPVASE